LKAAVVHKLGEIPRYEDFPDPVAADDQSIVDVVAASLENSDKALVSGHHYGSNSIYTKFPSVVGNDGVGIIDGKLMTFGCTPPYGSMAEKTVIQKSYASLFMEIGDGVDPALAAAMPSSILTSLLPLTFGAKLQKGETVLIQGATGFTGRIAVQVAKKLGAGRVVGTGRDSTSLKVLPALGADEVIDLKKPDVELENEFREKAGEGYDIILDFVWGHPTEILLKLFVPKALGFSAKDMRLVQIGEGAGHAVSLAADMLRTSGLTIMGATVGIRSEEVPALAAQAFQWIANSEIKAEVERVPLKEIEKAWTRQMPGKRSVIMPDVNYQMDHKSAALITSQNVDHSLSTPSDQPVTMTGNQPVTTGLENSAAVASIDGKWKLSMKWMLRKFEFEMEINSSGDKFVGKMKSSFLPKDEEIIDGRIDGPNLTWSVKTKIQVDILMRFSATRDRETLLGKIDAGRFGKFSFKGVRA
jgi:NADPH:quinone reductase-like Zn-dependent oxidoreductase